MTALVPDNKQQQQSRRGKWGGGIERDKKRDRREKLTEDGSDSQEASQGFSHVHQQTVTSSRRLLFHQGATGPPRRAAQEWVRLHCEAFT